MQARLFCKTGKLAGLEFIIRTEAKIGSDWTNDIKLYPSEISANHARIFFNKEEGCFYLEDLSSKTGTQLDGVKVQKQKRLGNLHVITFAGDFDFIFQVGDALEGPEPATGEGLDETRLHMDPVPLPSIFHSPDGMEEDTGDAQKTTLDRDFVEVPQFPSQLDVPPEKPSEPAPGKQKPTPVYLYQLVIPALDKVYDLEAGDNVIGRSLDCDIIIDNDNISRQHAVIVIDGDKVTIQDLGSTNHTFVDSEKITAAVQLKPGIDIRFGDLQVNLEHQTMGAK